MITRDDVIRWMHENPGDAALLCLEFELGRTASDLRSRGASDDGIRNCLELALSVPRVGYQAVTGTTLKLVGGLVRLKCDACGARIAVEPGQVDVTTTGATDVMCEKCRGPMVVAER